MKVSVIVPVYNVEKYFRECVVSILNNNYKDIEIILVDDGSPDKCPSICDEFATLDNRVTVIHKKNGGVVSAWKSGISIASGEFAMFVDSDDWIDANLIEDAVKCVKDSGVDIVCYNWIRNNDPTTLYKYPMSGRIRISDIVDNIIYYKGVNKLISNTRCTKLIKKNILIKAMDYCSENVSFGEDQQLTIACVLQVDEVFINSEMKGYHYRINNNSMVHTYNKDLYVKVNNVLDAMDVASKALSVHNFEEQIAKESVIYGIHVISNAFYTKSPKEDVYKVFKDERMSRGCKIINYSELRLYDRLMAKAIAKKSYGRVKIVRKLFNIKQTIKRG